MTRPASASHWLVLVDNLDETPPPNNISLQIDTNQVGTLFELTMVNLAER